MYGPVVTVGKEYTVYIKWIHKRCSGDLLLVNDGSRCKRCDGTIQEAGDLVVEATNDTIYKRWICHIDHKLLCKLCRTFRPPAMGARFTVFWGNPAMRTSWMAGAASHKSG